MEIEDIVVGSCIIIRNNGNETLLGIVEVIDKSRNEVRLRAWDNKRNKHYTLYISD